MAWASLAAKITTRPSRPSSSKKEKRALPKRESPVSSVLFWHQSRVGPRQREKKKREINWGKRGNRRFWEKNWCVPGKKMSLFSPLVTSHDISDYHHYWWATRFNFFCGELCFHSPNFPRKKCWRPQNIVQPHPSQFIFEVKGLKMIGVTLYRTERPPIQHIKKLAKKIEDKTKKRKHLFHFFIFTLDILPQNVAKITFSPGCSVPSSSYSFLFACLSLSIYANPRVVTILFTALRHTHKSTYAAKEKPTISFIYLGKKTFGTFQMKFQNTLQCLRGRRRRPWPRRL